MYPDKYKSIVLVIDTELIPFLAYLCILPFIAVEPVKHKNPIFHYNETGPTNNPVFHDLVCLTMFDLYNISY